MIYRRSLKSKIGILILDMRIREERRTWKKNLQEKDEHDNKKRKMNMKNIYMRIEKKDEHEKDLHEKDEHKKNLQERKMNMRRWEER